ncbi:MAG: peptide ABC transporter substrate-binding protein [Chloroflexi bacterium]|nr:MAG: peptide ABC transporter substrate-binding protein [Chloroflexota bacterium]
MKKASHLGRPSWKSAVSSSLAAASRTRSVRPAKREDCEHDRKDEPRHVQGDLTGAVREGQSCCVSIEGRHDVSRLLLTLLLAVTIGAACSPQRGPAAGGGTLVFAWQEPETLHPFYSTGTQTNALVYRVAVEGLVGVSPEGTPRPVLATGIPSTANGAARLDDAGGMVVRWTIRDGVRWSDGAPLTSADVRFTWRTVLSDPKVATREGYDRMADVETPDERTVVVRYRSIDVAYATRFDALLPRHLLEGADAAALAAYARAPLGTGPFRITEFASGDHVTAERNAGYRVPGKPALDRVIFRFVGSVDAAKAQLKAGEVDAALSLGEADAADLEKERDVRVVSAISPAVETLAFNLAQPVSGDIAIRRALLLATPKAGIVEKLLFGRTRPAATEVPYGWAAPKALAQEGYDPARARDVLERAGWLAGADGVRAKAGVRASLRIVSTTGNRLREQIEQVLVDEWRAIGVEARIQNVPNATLTGSWQSGGLRKRGEFDVLLAQTGITGADPQSYLAQRHRCEAIPRAENNGAGSNYERLCDPRIDALLDEAGRTLDPERRRAIYADVLATLNERAVAIWLYERGRYDAYRARVQGYVANGWDVATWNVAEWSLR